MTVRRKAVLVPALTEPIAAPPIAEIHIRELLVVALIVVAWTSKNWALVVKNPICPVLPVVGPLAVKLTVRPVTSGTLSFGCRLVMLLVAVFGLVTVMVTSPPVPALIESTWSWLLLARMIGALVVVAVTPAVAGVVVWTFRLMPPAPPALRLMAPPVTPAPARPTFCAIVPVVELRPADAVPALTA